MAGNVDCGVGNCNAAEGRAVDGAAGALPLDDVGLAGLDAFSRLEEEVQSATGGIETSPVETISGLCVTVVVGIVIAIYIQFHDGSIGQRPCLAVVER